MRSAWPTAVAANNRLSIPQPARHDLAAAKENDSAPTSRLSHSLIDHMPRNQTTCVPYQKQMRDAAARCLVDSFRDDPVCGAGSPLASVAEYDRTGVDEFRWFLWMFSAFGMIECATVAGSGAEGDAVLAAALWEPASPTLGFILRAILTFARMLWARGFCRTAQVVRFFFALEGKRHALAPAAHHLQILGTTPAAQGQGVGSELIKAGLDRADDLGVACYLESSNPRNVPFYLRHGFIVVEEYYHFETAEEKGPVLTLMLREKKRE
eukprot:COSAG05_NODE_6304_length_984_cov_1.048588_1_plen_267_part_00